MYSHSRTSDFHVGAGNVSLSDSDDMDGIQGAVGDIRDETDVRRSTRQRTLTEKAQIEHLHMLKNKSVASLSAVTKCKNTLIDLMKSVDNLHLVKSAHDTFTELYFRYLTCAELYCSELEPAERQGVQQIVDIRVGSMLAFRDSTQQWIKATEEELAMQVQSESASVSNINSRKSKASKVSSSRAGSSSSVSSHTFEKAKLAGLLAQRSLLHKKMEMEKTMHQTKMDIEEMKLDIAIAKSAARERVFAVAEGQDFTTLDDIQSRESKSKVQIVNETDKERPDSSNISITETKPKLPFSKENSSVSVLPKQSSERKEPSQNVLNPDANTFEPTPRGFSKVTQEQIGNNCKDQDFNTSHVFVEAQKQMVNAMFLPKPEVPKFQGDPTEFASFIMAFDARIAPHASTEADKLYYLNQHLQGEPKDLVSGCLYMDMSVGYQSARDMLFREYGDPYKVSSAYLNKVLSWPTLKQDDYSGLKQFSYLLIKCFHVMDNVSHMSVLNHAPHMQSIVQKLPQHLQTRWRDRVTKARMSGVQFVGFGDLVDFIDFAARSANEPVFGKQALSMNTERPKKANDATRNKSYVTKSQSFATQADDHAQDGRTKLLCYYCHQPHDIDNCKAFCSKSLAERRSYLIENNRCFGCYGRNHTVKGCLKRRKCRTCGRRHPTALHDKDFKYPDKPEDSSKNDSAETSLKQVTPSTTNCNSISSSINETILQPIIPVNVKQKGSGKVVATYALLDNGSTGCFITDSLREDLNAESVPTVLKLQTMNGTDLIDTSVVEDLIVSDSSNNNSVVLPRTFSRDVMPVEHDHIAKPEVLKHVSHLSQLADKLPAYRPDLEIGLLIGCNCPEALQPLVVIPSDDTGTFAVCYKLGWTMNGPLQLTHNLQDNTVVCNRIVLKEKVKVTECISPENVLKLFELDFSEHDIGKEPGQRGYSIEDQRFIDETEKNITFIDGHFQIPLPFRKSDVMPCNKQQAVKRVLWQRKKMLKNEKYYQDYVAFMNSILLKGYACEVPQMEVSGQPGHIWYLPHHGVYHPRKPNKIRVVFDCSAKFDGVSLNDVLLQGPDLTNSLIGVLTRFRKENVAFMGDVEAMFHQVKVPTDQQDYLRFLWWPDGDVEGNLKEYRMTVHTFGTISSPSIANYALKASAHKSEGKYDPEVAHTIERSFYVDDCLKSVKDDESAIKLISQLQSACAEGGFNLTKFTSNSKHVLSSLPPEHRSKEVQAIDMSCDDIPMERALGMQWHIQSDTFKFSVDLPDKPVTRRGILSTVSSLYDPLGIVSPVLLPAKKILQDLCKDKSLDWDDHVGQSCCDSWKRWLSELEMLRDLEVRRCLKPPAFGNLVSCQLHVFSDASNTGYGCAAYIRLCDQETIHTELLMGKARLAPLKTVTIPRLELTAATTAVKIGMFLQENLDMAVDSTTYYTDSTTVLHYISNEQNRYPVFVTNRVKLIRDYTDPRQWKYVDSQSNPADIASRGITSTKLLKSDVWFEGPSFLRSPEEEWPEPPNLSGNSSSETVCVTLTKSVSGKSASSGEETLSRLLEHYSSWHKLQRAVAIYRRFFIFLQHKAQKLKVSSSTSDPFTIQELSHARESILKFVQFQEYQSELNVLEQASGERGRAQLARSSPLYKLNPVIRDGLLCVGGRLSRANISEDTKHPIILPKKSHVSTLIIKDIHDRLGHVGRNHVLSALRTKYWITRANSAVRSVINKCVFCRRFKTPTSTQMMSDLPACRVNPAHPFTFTGIDLFGPHVVKEGRKCVKRYGVLFTCLSSRAVHIETANSLDTSSFINALRRFIARRGPVREIFCDNGTNFVGGARELKESLDQLDRGKIQSEMLYREINFNFNPPSASHMGGVWERLIRSVRNILNPMLHEFGSYLDDELYRTLLCEIEAILNSRPLTAVSGDSSDMDPLTPNHLLMMKPDVFIPPPGTFQQNHVYARQRWKRIQYLANVFWTRWKKEYLQSLQQRQKWNYPKRNFQKDDIVLIKDDTLPRSEWSMGRVIDTEMDKRGIVRSVLLKARGSEFRRPIHKLVLLLASGSA